MKFFLLKNKKGEGRQKDIKKERERKEHASINNSNKK
jgi:hypothetical protein